MLSIDLGGRTTKAVHLQRKGAGFALSRYALLDAPIFDKAPSAELLADHFKAISQTMQLKTKQICLTLPVGDSVIRQMDCLPCPWTIFARF